MTSEAVGLARYSASERGVMRDMYPALSTGKARPGVTIASRHPRFGRSECTSASRLHVVRHVAILWNTGPRPLFGAAWTCGGYTTYPVFFEGPDADDVPPCARCDFEGTNDVGPVVYYVRRDDRIKIGFTTNLPVRVATLAAELLAWEPGGLGVERQRQQLFADARIAGEWFRPVPELLSHIAEIVGVRQGAA